MASPSFLWEEYFKLGYVGLKPFSKTLPYGEGGPRSGG